MDGERFLSVGQYVWHLNGFIFLTNGLTLSVRRWSSMLFNSVCIMFAPVALSWHDDLKCAHWCLMAVSLALCGWLESSRDRSRTISELWFLLLKVRLSVKSVARSMLERGRPFSWVHAWLLALFSWCSSLSSISEKKPQYNLDRKKFNVGKSWF
jgi:hypothetical protein